MFALASYNAKNMPSFGAIGVDAMPYSSAGASAVEELGAAMATARPPTCAKCSRAACP